MQASVIAKRSKKTRDNSRRLMGLIFPAIALLGAMLPSKSTAQSVVYPNTPAVLTVGVPVSLTPIGIDIVPVGSYHDDGQFTDGRQFSQHGIAVDSKGNVYLGFVRFDGKYAITEVSGGNWTTVGGIYSQPPQFAVDVLGSLYVADGVSSTIHVYLAGGGTPVEIGSGFSHPTAVGLDAAGNLYVADSGNQAVYKISGSGPPILLTTDQRLDNIQQMAVDASGNIYLANAPTSLNDPASGLYKLIAGGGTLVHLSTEPLSGGTGIAIDTQGNLFESVGNYIRQTFPDGHIQTISLPYNVFVNDLAVDYTGNIYYNSDGGWPGKFSLWGGYHLANPAQPLPPGLSLAETTGVISGTPTAVSNTTDYGIAADGTPGTTVTITVNPAAPTLSYTGSPVFIKGTPISPITPVSARVAPPRFAPPLLYGSALNTPSGVVVDDLGDIFVSDFGTNSIKEILRNKSVITVAAGFNGPRGLAIDAAQNIYVADCGNNVIKKIPASGGAVLTVGPVFNSPYAVAVDNSGNIYVADFGNSAIKMIPAAGGPPVTLGSGFVQPNGVALDPSGNIYVTDQSKTAVTVIPAGGGALFTMGSGLQNQAGIAVDNCNDIFVVTTSTLNFGSLVKITPDGTQTEIEPSAGFNLDKPVAVFADGALIVADQANSQIPVLSPVGGFYISPALPAGLLFNNSTGTITGTPTVASPATVYNVICWNITASAQTQLTLQVDLPPPVISYPSPKVYKVGTAITALAPTSSGVAAPGYSNNPVILSSGFSFPIGVAVDGPGNVYIADNGNNAVKKMPYGVGNPASLGSGLADPFGVAVDAFGNVYVADLGNNAVKMIPAAGGSPIIIGSGFNQPTGVAVDAGGDVFVVDNGNNAVKEVPFGGGAIITLGSGFLDPFGIALDAAGNIYITDRGHNAVKKISAGGGTPAIIASGFNAPDGIAVDPAGNIFVADSKNNAVQELPVGGGAAIIIGAGFNNPTGVAVNAQGLVYVTDENNNAVKQIQPIGGYYISMALPPGLAFDGATGIISGTPTTNSTATPYTVTAYNTGGTSSATVQITVVLPTPVIAYAGPQTYTVGTAISPLAPTNSGSPVSGYGGPFKLGSGFNHPLGVAVDAAGNVYVADTFDNMVKKIPANGGAVVKLDSLGQPGSVAVDAAGNVYVPDVTNYAITMIPAAGGAPVTFGSGFNLASGIAVDSKGNVYYSDAASAVKMIPAGGGATVTFAMGFNQPQGLAVDAAGNVYVADNGNNAVKEIPAGGGASTIIGFGFNRPYGVAVDAAGNLYVADEANHAIKKVPAGSNTPVILTTGSVTPAGIAVDATGNIYIADQGNSAVEKLKRGSYYISPALPAGLSFNGNTGVISGTPTTASPATSFAIIAYNSAGSDTTTVNISVGGNARLSALKLNTGTLSPAFAGTTYSYTAGVANSVTSITVTPTIANGGATVKVNGTPVTSGSASQNISLAVGSNIVSTVVTAQDGVTTQIYTLTVSRAASANANLAAINPGVMPLSPVFAPATTNYVLNVGNATATMTVKPVTGDINAKIKVNGTALNSGTVSQPIPLAEGAATAITIVVTAQDGTTTKTYAIAVTRAVSADATLSNISLSNGTLSPAFAAATTAYTAGVPNSAADITLTPTAKDANATIKVNGTAIVSGTPSIAIPLNTGVNTITTVVTAQNGATTKTYTLTVTRALSPDASLSGIQISTGALSPAFASGTASYTASVSNVTTSITVTPTTTNAIATVKVNGTSVSSGSASGPIFLSVGQNTITTVVTAQDGVTTKTYTVAVTRVASANANLSGINPSATPLSPAFAPATTSYTLSVANSVGTMTVRPVTSDASATMKVNGTSLASGTTASPIALAVGSNTINIAVTAQNGTTIKTYTITVTRAAAPSNSLDADNSVTKPTETPVLAEDGIVIHPGISPNGDGVNDFLQIDNIGQYPDNKITIMNRNGQLVYEAKGYNNSSKVFDGHSNKNGQMQLPGTYFYQLDYTINGITKHKTGFIVLKY